VAEFVISAAIAKFEGATLRDLAQDDLVFLARVSDWHSSLGRALGNELRRRERLVRRRQGRRRNRRSSR
jgi:hypothetical protein